MTKERIVIEANREITIQKNSIEQSPALIQDLDENINDLSKPARKFDIEVCNLTIAVNAKIRELEVLTGVIQSTGCGSSITDPISGLLRAVGDNVSYDVVNAGRSDMESNTHVGINPYSTGIFGANTAMTTGTNPTVIVDSTLGIGTITRVAAGTTYQAQESLANSIVPPGDACEVNSGDAYDSTYSGHDGTAFATRRTELLSEIAEARTKRDNFMNATIKGVKAEIHTKYTRRYSYILGVSKAKERKTELEQLSNLTTEDEYTSYFT